MVGEMHMSPTGEQQHLAAWRTIALYVVYLLPCTSAPHYKCDLFCKHVARRQSKLTSVLRDALGGNCRTVLVANVWPEQAHLDESVSTLRFAARMRR